MAESFYGRRLSDLLQEQQEPFLLASGASLAEACRRRLLAFCHRRAAVSNKSRAFGGLGTAVFCGSAVRRALLAGCFSCGARQSFRRLRHNSRIAARCDADRVELDDDDEECARQLSPVSVLELHSDEESSPMLGVSHREEDESPSTSRKSSPSPPEQNSLDAAAVASPCFTFYEAAKNCKTETGEEEYDTTRSKLEEQMIISSWERIAGDISRIPVLVEHDLTGSAQQWRRREEEASQVGASIEAMIFEEMRVEAVRDMMFVA
uniref:DUF4378 domain-containing protein n=1 Tax=Oryza punctata TaxID=4537 RepID=A0A0E0MPZ9_ORYPU